MSKENLTTKAYESKIFAKGNGEFIRTVPAKGKDAPYIGYIKIISGESKVSHNSPVLFDVLVSGEEISEKEYNEAKLIAVNDLE